MARRIDPGFSLRIDPGGCGAVSYTHLEVYKRQLNAIAFDKTGTLTKGEPRIQKVITAPGVEEEELMAIAVAVESLSDHPLAQAIARDGKDYVCLLYTSRCV